MIKPFDGSKLLKEVLSEGEIRQLEAFNANPAMKEAVKKVLLLPIYSQGVLEAGKSVINPHFNFALGLVASDVKLTDEQVGRYLKVQAEGIHAVQAAFERISQFIAEERSSEEINEAR